MKAILNPKIHFLWLFWSFQVYASEFKAQISCLSKIHLLSYQSGLIENTAVLENLKSYNHPNIDAAVQSSSGTSGKLDSPQSNATLEINDTLFDSTAESKITAYKSRQNAEIQEIKEKLASITVGFFAGAYQVQSLKNQMEIFENRKTKLEKVIGYLKDLTKVGASDGSDLLFAESEFLRIESEISRIRILLLDGELLVSNYTTGQPGPWSFFLADVHPSESDALYWRYKQDRIPSILKESLRSRSFLEERKSFEFQLTPRVEVAATAGSNTKAYSGTFGDQTVSLRLVWPLWDKSDRQIQRDRLNAASAIYRQKAQISKTTFENELNYTLKSIKEIELLKMTLKKRITLSEKSLEVAWTKFKLKKLNFQEYRIIEETLSEAKQRLKQADLDQGLMRSRLFIWDEFASNESITADNIDCTQKSKLPIK